MKIKVRDSGHKRVGSNSPNKNSDMEPPKVDTLTKVNQGTVDMSAPIKGKTDTNKFGHSWNRGPQGDK